MLLTSIAYAHKLCECTGITKLERPTNQCLPSVQPLGGVSRCIRCSDYSHKDEQVPAAKHEKIRSYPNPHQSGQEIMDVERINLIGTTLADLGRRALDLRGYL